MSLESLKQKFFADFTTIAESFLAAAGLLFLLYFLLSEFADSCSSDWIDFFAILFYLVTILDLFVGSIMMTILNVRQKKGQIILSEIKYMNVGPKQTYILADNWYVSFLWMWFVAMTAPFVLLPCGLFFAIEVAKYLIWLAISFGVFVNLRATCLSIKQARMEKEKKAES